MGVRCLGCCLARTKGVSTHPDRAASPEAAAWNFWEDCLGQQPPPPGFRGSGGFTDPQVPWLGQSAQTAGARRRCQKDRAVG